MVTAFSSFELSDWFGSGSGGATLRHGRQNVFFAFLAHCTSGICSSVSQLSVKACPLFLFCCSQLGWSRFVLCVETLRPKIWRLKVYLCLLRWILFQFHMHGSCFARFFLTKRTSPTTLPNVSVHFCCFRFTLCSWKVIQWAE